MSTGVIVAAGNGGQSAGPGLPQRPPPGPGPPRQPAARRDSFARHRGLMAFSAGCAMAEAAVLAVVAPAAGALAPQITALPPFAIFHDLRWLFGYNRSWPEFAGGMAILLLARSGLNTTLVRLAWPRDVPAPRLADTFSASLAFTMLASVMMAPITTIIFGIAVLPFSWPFLAAVPVLLAITLPLSHGGVTRTWWRRLPPARAAWWALACFVEYSVAGVAIARLPAAGVVPMAGLAGLVNARAWFGVTDAVARSSRPAQRSLASWIPVAPLAAVSVFAVAIGATRLVFEIASAPPRVIAAAGVTAAGRAPAASARSDSRPAVLVVAGFGSSCCHKASSLQRAASGMIVRQFSYRGLDAAGKPIPQGRYASDLPLPELGDRIAAQVQRLHADTGRPVDVVAESEGTLGIYAMLARHPGVPVSAIALLSPIMAPGQVSFPEAGGQDAGLASEYALRALNKLVGDLSPFGSSGAERLIDSVGSVGARYAAATAAAGRTRRWLVVVPLADALTLPTCVLPPSVLFVPAFHGGLLGDAPVLRMVRDFLAGRPVSGPGELRTAAEIMASAAAAWRMPERAAPSPPCPG